MDLLLSSNVLLFSPTNKRKQKDYAKFLRSRKTSLMKDSILSSKSWGNFHNLIISGQVLVINIIPAQIIPSNQSNWMSAFSNY